MAAKEKKGLGTGLGILFGEDAYTDENELKLLPLGKLEPRQTQPRSVFDDEALQELAESVKRYGVIQPVTARRLPSGYYQIIAGERRWRAARLAGLEEIPVRVVEADDRRTAELALVENLQRQDLNPIEEALGYQKLIADLGLSQEEAAAKVGRSRPYITNALRLLTLPENVREMLASGALSAGHGRALAALNEPQAAEAAKAVIEGELSVRETERLVKRILENKPKETKKNDDVTLYVRDLERRLAGSTGHRVTIRHGKKKGKLTIEYYGNEDLERICAALGRIENNK
jgi:ParB family chromosome partitioning protein